MKKISVFFYLKIFNFLEAKFSIYLNKQVFIMHRTYNKVITEQKDNKKNKPHQTVALERSKENKFTAVFFLLVSECLLRVDLASTQPDHSIAFGVNCVYLQFEILNVKQRPQTT